MITVLNVYNNVRNFDTWIDVYSNVYIYGYQNETIVNISLNINTKILINLIR